MPNSLIIDRLEPPWAILETSDGIIFNFPLKHLPEGVKEGYVLRFDIEIVFKLSRGVLTVTRLATVGTELS